MGRTLKRVDEFDPRISLSLEKVLVQMDYSVLLSLLRDSPDELKKGLEKLEKVVHQHGAVSNLDALCAARCERRALLWLLHPFSREPIFADARWSIEKGPRSIKTLFGITSKELKDLTKHLDEIAGQIQIVNDQAEFGSLLILSKPIYPAWRLPRTLRTYAKLLRYAARHFAGNSHIYRNIAKARLTAYVKSRLPDPEAWRDEDIANLISAVSDEENYDATSHRMWRTKHYRRLSVLDPNVELHELIAASNIVLALTPHS